MTSSEEARRKKVYFRCHHTGMKENDILLGTFAEKHMDDLSEEDVGWLESFIMDHNDIDIYNWIVGNKSLPDDLDHPVMRRLMASINPN